MKKKKNKNKNTISRILPLLVCCVFLILQGCHIGYPFRGPGFDSKEGPAIDYQGKEVLVAITHGVVDSAARQEFSTSLEDVRKAMTDSPGLIGYSVRRQIFGGGVWTMSAWESEEALLDFIDSPAHQAAVVNGGISPESVRSAYLWVTSNRLPLPWDEAEKIFEAQQ